MNGEKDEVSAQNSNAAALGGARDAGAVNSADAADAFGELVVARVEKYMHDLDGQRGRPLYEMIVMAAERPLLTWAMEKCGSNQRAAAQLLGINRNTLHKKLVLHGFLNQDF